MEVTPAGYAGSLYGAASTQSKNPNQLDINDFFALLAAELKNQSMYDPVNDREFMGQMAQFSVLQQMQEMNNTFKTFMTVSFIGKEVTAQAMGPDSMPVTVNGIVDRVEFINGKAYLFLGDIAVEAGNVISVANVKEKEAPEGNAADEAAQEAVDEAVPDQPAEETAQGS